MATVDTLRRENAGLRAQLAQVTRANAAQLAQVTRANAAQLAQLMAANEALTTQVAKLTERVGELLAAARRRQRVADESQHPPAHRPANLCLSPPSTPRIEGL